MLARFRRVARRRTASYARKQGTEVLRVAPLELADLRRGQAAHGGGGPRLQQEQQPVQPCAGGGEARGNGSAGGQPRV